MHNDPTAAQRIILEAIVRKRRVTAVYNGAELALAPHQLFLRHDALFVSAVNLSRTPRADEAPRLGNFKLDGLTRVTLTQDAFDPLPGFDAALPRPEDQPVLAVEIERHDRAA